MIDIKVFEDGKLKKAYKNVQTHFEMINNYYKYDIVNLNFACDRVAEYSNSKVWTGKFICVANRGDGRFRYTPGRVYEATLCYIADDTQIPFNRGTDWQFTSSDFETLRKEFSEHGIDIIEYKDEKTVEE